MDHLDRDRRQRRRYAEKPPLPASEAGQIAPGGHRPSAAKAAEVARAAPKILNSISPRSIGPCQGSFRQPASTLSAYLDEVILHGGGQGLDDILRLRDEIGLDYLLCAPLSHQSFMLLTEQVLPRLL
jgi:hypothetical protein